MFGLFRRKPKYTGEQILAQLGRAAGGIVSAAEESGDVMIGLKGAAVVAAMIKEADRCFGITVQPETIFAHFVAVIQEQDLAKMAEMTKEMANALQKVEGPLHRGGLIHFWFKGYN
ncbi:MAG: hypothetical protein ACREUW_20035 [Burkholderiales bacterium]